MTLWERSTSRWIVWRYENWATHCNTLQHTATHMMNLWRSENEAHHVGSYQEYRIWATHCNTLQHTATHCNTHDELMTLWERSTSRWIVSGVQNHIMLKKMKNHITLEEEWYITLEEENESYDVLWRYENEAHHVGSSQEYRIRVREWGVQNRITLDFVKKHITLEQEFCGVLCIVLNHIRGTEL